MSLLFVFAVLPAYEQAGAMGDLRLGQVHLVDVTPASDSASSSSSSSSSSASVSASQTFVALLVTQRRTRDGAVSGKLSLSHFTSRGFVVLHIIAPLSLSLFSRFG